jgi:predicted RNase H-like HicB family nuclease
MMTRLTLTARYETVDEGWVQAQLQEMPAVITVAPTRDEAEELLIDALKEYLLSFGGSAPQPTDHSADEGRLEITIQAA